MRTGLIIQLSDQIKAKKDEKPFRWNHFVLDRSEVEALVYGDEEERRTILEKIGDSVRSSSIEILTR